MFNFSNKNVLITGGASGIGKLMGELVLQKGAKLIIWDINQKNIDETRSQFSKFGTVVGYNVDVADIEQVKITAKIVKEEHGSVDVLINNAGIIVGKYFHEHSNDDITKTMNINANAPMHIALAFLSDMMKQNSGYICNIASSAGLISNPKMAVYAASKWS
ncbi:MAG TPA: SDR family NAD(P)-dependent oxidoreductase, partial [Flavobacterium sp.]|nr:SDR family NAD(P)-dependent oxidoreductase [Flavobacterium sp.]